MKDKLIVALDYSDLQKINEGVKELSPYVACFKVGLEALTALGAPQVVEVIHKADGKVFLDGKFDDIPNTIAKASKAASHLGVSMFNVHASCGMDAIKAASQEKGNSTLLVVTVLTSMDEGTCQHIFGAKPKDAVIKFALDAKRSGADGVICSPAELEFLSQEQELHDFQKVTPGVRPQWAASNDQKRTLTPREAIDKGATQLVIGRPITQAPPEIGTPAQAAQKILQELET